MKSFLKTVFVLFCLAGWMLAGLTLHVVRTPDGVIGIIPKNRLGITDTYIDVRTWSPKDLAGHEDLIRRVLDAKKSHWLKHIAPEGTNTDVWLGDFLATGNPSTSQPTKTKPASRSTTRGALGRTH